MEFCTYVNSIFLEHREYKIVIEKKKKRKRTQNNHINSVLEQENIGGCTAAQSDNLSLIPFELPTNN